MGGVSVSGNSRARGMAWDRKGTMGQEDRLPEILTQHIWSKAEGRVGP